MNAEKSIDMPRSRAKLPACRIRALVPSSFDPSRLGPTLAEVSAARVQAWPARGRRRGGSKKTDRIGLLIKG